LPIRPHTRGLPASFYSPYFLLSYVKALFID
jgi:hypothetical protein